MQLVVLLVPGVIGDFWLHLGQLRSYLSLLFWAVILLRVSMLVQASVVGCGLNDNLISRALWCYFSVVGWSSAVGAPTGPCWCCLKGHKMLPEASFWVPWGGGRASLAHRLSRLPVWHWTGGTYLLNTWPCNVSL